MVNAAQQIVVDALRRFPDLPSRTIARYILEDRGQAFDNDLEKIRGYIRRQRGTCGEKHRQGMHKEKTPILALPQSWSRERAPFYLDDGLWLVLADLHIPFHDKKAILAAIEYGKKQKVTGIFIDGDAQDCASISFWAQTIKRDFDAEVEAFIDFLDFLRQQFPKAKIVYKPGNHEYRLPRLFQSKIPELIGIPLAAMDAILGLESRGIELLDYFQLVYAGDLPILHGHEVKTTSTVVNPARGLFLKTKMWSMCAHHHRTSEHPEKTLEGKLLTCWSIGCLCDLSPDYMPYNQWNHGFATVEVKGKHFEVVNRRILGNGKVV